MIIIQTKAGIKHEFNVPDERNIMLAWHAMSGEDKYATKSFKFVDKADGEVTKIKIGDIKSCIQCVDVEAQTVL
jgi:hypothetical protein